MGCHRYISACRLEVVVFGSIYAIAMTLFYYDQRRLHEFVGQRLGWWREGLD
jgi:hypothetical protein